MKKAAALFFLYFFLPLAVFAQSENEVEVKVGTTLVPIGVSINNNGTPLLEKLTAQNFTVKDEGRDSKVVDVIQEAPVSFAVMIDCSQSMQYIDWDLVLSSVAKTLETLALHDRKSQNEYALMTFANGPTSIVVPFTSDVQKVLKALVNVKTTDLGTNLLGGIVQATDYVKTGQCLKKGLLVVSDGQDNVASYKPDEFHRLIKTADVRIYTLCVQHQVDGDSLKSTREAGEKLMQAIAATTGALSSVHRYEGRELSEFEKLRASWAVVDFCNDILSEYIVFTEPVETKSNKFRKLVVKLINVGSGFILRHREGYMPANPGSP